MSFTRRRKENKNRTLPNTADGEYLTFFFLVILTWVVNFIAKNKLHICACTIFLMEWGRGRVGRLLEDNILTLADKINTVLWLREEKICAYKSLGSKNFFLPLKIKNIDPAVIFSLESLGLRVHLFEKLQCFSFQCNFFFTVDEMLEIFFHYFPAFFSVLHIYKCLFQKVKIY